MRRQPKTWLVTGCAGFIGSHLIETLLNLNQKVVGLDNFSTGHRKNLNLVRKVVGKKAWKRFHFVRGDIRKMNDCYKAFGVRHPSSRSHFENSINRRKESKIDIVLHQAALGSVPRSIKDPLTTHDVNVTGFVNMLRSAQNAGVKRFVYASSSSVYGDSPVLPKREDRIGNQLSPYAVSKYTNELYAGVFGRCYGLETIGLRYFNVFGPRQDPNGQYAAVIPRWIAAIKKGDRVRINGDGKTSRDFCYVENAVQANILAALGEEKKVTNQAYNVACGNRTSLLILNKIICRKIKTKNDKLKINDPIYCDYRNGDVRHSLASIAKTRRFLSFSPTIKVKEGILRTINFYMASKKTGLKKDNSNKI
jgi:UDP-N-acetylglucosamine 4-epimerase